MFSCFLVNLRTSAPKMSLNAVKGRHVSQRQVRSATGSGLLLALTVSHRGQSAGFHMPLYREEEVQYSNIDINDITEEFIDELVCC